MKTGYLETLDEIDFSLPEDHSFVDTVLSGKRAGKVELLLGMEGWTDKGYVGKVYPPKTKSRDFLIHYSKLFNAVEVNSTRFSIPSKEVVSTWKDQTPENFRFGVKLPQYISHQRVLNSDDVFEDVDTLLETFGVLESKLGSCYLQLPSTFKAERLPELYQFIEYFPEEFNLSIEVRSSTILRNDKVFDEMLKTLASYNVSTAISDLPDRRDLIHMALSNKTAYVRLSGNRLHRTDYTRCDEWATRINRWIDKGLEKVFFFIHQPAPNKATSADLVNYMAEKLNTDH